MKIKALGSILFFSHQAKGAESDLPPVVNYIF